MECDGNNEWSAKTYHPPVAAVDEVLGDYPTLQATTDQDDPGLTHTTVISDADDLQTMVNAITGNYYLTGNIDAAETSTWNGGLGFDPGRTFTGTFDGCGYTISNLFINRPNETSVGLFSQLTAATVANLTLADVDITGYGYVGAITGVQVAQSGQLVSLIQNCHSSGAIKSTKVGSAYRIGGLIGGVSGDLLTAVYGYVYDSSSSCDITITNGVFEYELGGLIGNITASKVSNCFSTGAVIAGTGSSDMGGFAGEAAGGAFIYYSYATGDITGNANVGGFIGQLNNTAGIGEVSKCYATGDVTLVGTTPYGAGFACECLGDIDNCYAWGDVTSAGANSDGGGFAHHTNASSTIENCYAIGAIDVTLAVGGFITDLAAGATFTSDYWDTETSGTETSNGGTGKTTTQMKTKGTYIDWDFDDVWDMAGYVAATDAVDEYWTYTEGRDLSPLEGETVSILADGVWMPDQVVTDSDIDDTDFADAEDVHIGLKYESKLKPMKPLSHADMMKKKATCKQMGISVQNTDEIEYGVTDDDMKEINFDDVQWTNKCDIDGLFTGIVKVNVPDTFNRDMPLQISTDAPLPCTVRGMIPKVDVTGD